MHKELSHVDGCIDVPIPGSTMGAAVVVGTLQSSMVARRAGQRWRELRRVRWAWDCVYQGISATLPEGASFPFPASKPTSNSY